MNTMQHSLWLKAEKMGLTIVKKKARKFKNEKRE
jgi:hypothetical protein